MKNEESFNLSDLKKVLNENEILNNIFTARRSLRDQNPFQGLISLKSTPEKLDSLSSETREKYYQVLKSLADEVDFNNIDSAEKVQIINLLSDMKKIRNAEEIFSNLYNGREKFYTQLIKQVNKFFEKSYSISTSDALEIIFSSEDLELMQRFREDIANDYGYAGFHMIMCYPTNYKIWLNDSVLHNLEQYFKEDNLSDPYILHNAVLRKDLNIVKDLKKTIKLSLGDETGQTPLDLAAKLDFSQETEFTIFLHLFNSPCARFSFENKSITTLSLLSQDNSRILINYLSDPNSFPNLPKLKSRIFKEAEVKKFVQENSYTHLSKEKAISLLNRFEVTIPVTASELPNSSPQNLPKSSEELAGTRCLIL